MSEFDEADIINDEFDQADIVADADPFKEEKASAPVTIGDQAADAAWGAGGAVVGSGANWLLEAGVNKGVEAVGALDRADIKKIDDNREIYKELKKSKNPLEDMLDTFRGLGEKNIKTGVKSADTAVEALRGQPAMPIQEYYKTIAQPAASNMDFSDALPEDTKQRMLAQQLDAIATDQAPVKQRLSQIEEELASPFKDERLEINQSIKDAKYGNKLEQLNAPLPENAKLPIVDNFVEQKGNAKLQSMEDLLAQVKQQSPQPVLDRKEDMLFNLDTDNNKNEKLREIDIARGGTPDYEKLQVRTEAADMKNARKLDRIDEKVVKIESKIEKDSQKVEQKKQAFQQDMANRQQKTSALRDIDQNMAQSRVESRKDQLVFNRILDDEKTAQMKNLKQKEKMEKLLSEKASLQSKLEKGAQGANKAAEESYLAEQRTPKKILDVTPELQGRALRQGYADSLTDGIKGTNYLEELELPAVHKRVRELQEADVNYEQGGVVNNFKKDMARSLSDKLKENDTYKTHMGTSEKSYETEALWEKLGIKNDKKLKRVTLEDSGRSKINQILIDGEKNKVSKEYLVEALKDAEAQGHIPKGTTIESLMNRAEVAALQGEVGRLKSGKELNPFDVNQLAKGDMSRTPGVVSKYGGTRLQELMGMYKNSVGGKMVQGAGKYGLPILGGMAAYSTAADAASTGELSPEAALLSGTAEAFNPLPGLDAVEAAKGGAKGIDQALAENTQEELTAMPELGANDMGGADLVGQNPLVQKAISGFAKGAVSQIPSMAQGAAESFSQAGFARSDDARARMEQNSKAADMFSNKKASAPHEDFKSFVEQKPEQVQELAQFFSNDEKYASFAAPLEKAASADERTRSAVLFGLYQQPAFRQAMKKRK